jgi:hypothetical protein
MIILVKDDLHLRHDVAILPLLRHLLTTTPASLLLISREEVPLLGIMSIRLVGLEHDEGMAPVEQLAIHTPGADGRIYPYAERLLDRTGGNPFRAAAPTPPAPGHHRWHTRPDS